MAQKLLADSNRASLREIIEDNELWGETPAAGVSRARRFTTSSIVVTKDTVVSEEIRDDRMVSSVIETAAQSGGEINWEFAAGTIDNDLQRVLMGAWSRPMAFDVFRGNQVAVNDADEIAISGDSVVAYFTVGRRIKTAGFLNPANNTYLTVTAVAYTGGQTVLTVSGAVLVAEEGNAFATVSDANDVVILHNTAIRFGNTARRIDSNGANVFAAARAAKQLVAGQRIHVEGVGYETATVTIAALADGDSITLSDGDFEYTFEAQSDADVVDQDAFLFAIGANVTESAANLALKINAQRGPDFALIATAAAGVLTLTNTLKEGGSITDADASFTVVDFAGGNEDLGGFYQIVSITDDAITVDRDVPAAAAGKRVTIKGSMIRNPGNKNDITAQSSSLETGFNDVGQYFLADGLRSGGLSMEVSAGAIVTGSTTIMGRQTKRSKIEKLTSNAYTALDAAATEVVSATANVGTLIVDGVATSSAIQSINFSLEGNLRVQQAVGSKFPIGIAAGRLGLSGTITVYFADGTMYDRFLNHDTVSLAFPITDQDGNTYFFTIPAFKVSSDPVAPGGTDQDVMESLEFTAFRDSATKCMMQVDRFSSIDPITAL